MIKSTIDNKEAKKEKPFPKLMIRADKCIVLFSKNKVGVIVSFEGQEGDIGYYYDSWMMSEFDEFDGSITLSNEV